MPKKEKRKVSGVLGRRALRLPLQLERLKHPDSWLERMVARMWHKENAVLPAPFPFVLGAQPPAFSGRVRAILNEGNPSRRDVEIVNSTIQWLGTGVGICFCREVVETYNRELVKRRQARRRKMQKASGTKTS
ncbi:MAG: hypothetical protein U0522_02745 [Candidatus Paceibacterota bacterium]